MGGHFQSAGSQTLLRMDCSQTLVPSIVNYLSCYYLLPFYFTASKHSIILHHNKTTLGCYDYTTTITNLYNFLLFY